jgi:WD40 repeat protein
VTGAHGLLGAGSVTVSADGANVYVVAGNALSGMVQDDSIVSFRRDPTTGAVSETGCIGQTTAHCELATQGMQSPTDVAASPDGARVYVAAATSGVTVFSRASDGALTPAGCFRDPGDTVDSSCTPVTGFVAGGARGLAVSPDSKFVYAAAQNGNAIAIFQRTPASLSYMGCVSGGASPNPACSPTTDVGLLGVTALAINPTGDRLYAVSYAGNALDVFARNPTTGAITAELGCASLQTGGGESGCAYNMVPGMDNTRSVAVSADGSHVYTASIDGTVDSFATTSGPPGVTPLGCIGAAPPATPTPGCASNAGIGLRGATQIVLAPNAGPGTVAAYVSSFFDSAVAEFEIDPGTGALQALPAPDGCITGGAKDESCTGPHGDGLISADGIALSPDGNNVYVASRGAGKERPGCGGTCTDTVSALAVFSRFAAPTVTASPPANVTATSATLRGQVNPNGTDATYHFELSTDPGFTAPVSLPAAGADAGAGGTAVPVTAAATALKPGTTYYFRLVASNRGGHATSTPPQQFTTAAGASTTTVTGTIGDQRLALTIPATCVSDTLTVSLSAKTLRGKRPKLHFTRARLYIDRGRRHRHKHHRPTFSPNATVHKLPATVNLSLKGLKSRRTHAEGGGLVQADHHPAQASVKDAEVALLRLLAVVRRDRSQRQPGENRAEREDHAGAEADLARVPAVDHERAEPDDHVADRVDVRQRIHRRRQPVERHEVRRQEQQREEQQEARLRRLHVARAQRDEDPEARVRDPEQSGEEHDHERAEDTCPDVRTERDPGEQHNRRCADSADEVRRQPAEDDRRARDRSHEQLVEVAEIDLGHQSKP